VRGGEKLGRREVKRGIGENRGYLLPILLTALLVRVERTAFRTRLGVAELGVLTLSLVLLRRLNLRSVASSTSKSSAASAIKAASGIGLLDSTKATLGTLPNSNILSCANATHVFTGTTVRLERILRRSSRSLSYSLGSTPRTPSGAGSTSGLTQTAHETLKTRTPVQLLVVVSWKGAANVLMLVMVPNVIVRT